eukprot:COSAG01_NODE_428_length_17193_cov_45.999123_14_plen_99_part_00
MQTSTMRHPHSATSKYSSASRRRSEIICSSSVASLMACSSDSWNALRSPAEDTEEIDVTEVTDDANENEDEADDTDPRRRRPRPFLRRDGVFRNRVDA